MIVSVFVHCKKNPSFGKRLPKAGPSWSKDLRETGRKSPDMGEIYLVLVDLWTDFRETLPKARIFFYCEGVYGDGVRVLFFHAPGVAVGPGRAELFGAIGGISYDHSSPYFPLTLSTFNFGSFPRKIWPAITRPSRRAARPWRGSRRQVQHYITL